MRRYYVCAKAGDIGRSENGYPIRDEHMVMMLDDSTTRYFLLKEEKAVFYNGALRKNLHRRNRYEGFNSKAYLPVYYLDGAPIKDSALITTYKVTEMTDIVMAIKKFYSSEKNTTAFITGPLHMAATASETDSWQPKPDMIAAIEAILEKNV